MTRTTPTRTAHTAAAPMLRILCAPVLLLISCAAVSAQGNEQRRPAPIVRQAPSPQQNVPQRFGPGRSPHLPQWMQSHQNMPLDQQQRALQAEPGFTRLDPAAQQRMHERLSQLNAMSPQQRERVMQRTEAMERLQPDQRQQVRSAMQGLGALPEDRRRAVARTFRMLRDLPEPQRQGYLNSPQMRGQFSDHERETLNQLIMVSPYLPPPIPPGPQAPR